MKKFFAGLLCLGLVACDKPDYTLVYFMHNPAAIEPVLLECDGLSLPDRLKSQPCIDAERAHNTYAQLILDATLTPAAFGDRIIQEQMRLGQLQSNYEQSPTTQNHDAYIQQYFRVRVMLNAVEMSGN